MKKIIFVFFIVFKTTTYSQTDYAFVYNNDSIIKKGISLYEEEKYTAAILEFDKIGKADPKFLNAQHEKALALSALDKKNDLKLFFEDLYSKNAMPEFPSLYTLYGSFLSNQKEYDQAEKIFKEGEKYLSNSSNFLYNFAILYYRKEESQKSVDLLKRIITTNPNHASAHYLLGALALDNGKIVEGTLALMSYLIIAPTGQFAEKAILNLNAKFGQNYLESNKLIFSKSGDNFEDIEVILRNQLPLKPAYKIKSEIDDVIIRQIQAVAEYSVAHKMSDGFFENTYIPWIKNVIEKKQFEGFSYYILLGMETQLGKKLTSQKKKINAFYEEYLLKDFWKTYGKRTLDHFGEQEEVIITLKDGNPHFISPQINGKMDGKVKYLNEDGNLIGELNFKDDELHGFQKYFDEKGNRTEEKTFVNGKVDGLRTDFLPNGLISLTENFKLDVLNGLNTSYYPNGGKQCEVNFVNGERDGKLICLYINGSVKTETNYSSGKLNGPLINYNEVGDIIESCQYTNDLLEGNYAEYYDGKQIKSEAVYSNGKIQNSYKKYYSNGVLEMKNDYVDGKIKKSITYFANGKKSIESAYNDKEEIENYISYDSNEDKYYEEKYKSGELKIGYQYTRNNPKPIEISMTKKPFVMTDFDGKLLAKGDLEKGQKINEWNYYYPTGILKIKENHIKGKQNGLNTSYSKNELLTSIINYTNDTINGLYEVYQNGRLSSQYNYVNGDQSGPYKAFYSNGSISNEGNFQNALLNFDTFSYWQNGLISKKESYLNGMLTNSIIYNNKGEKENTIDYKNRTGKFTTNYNNGTILEVAEITNGQLNGKLLIKDKFNTLIMESEFINGVKHNLEKIYSQNGTIQLENNYYSGKLNGSYKVYDLAGNLRLTDEMTFGNENGKTTRFYHNKIKMNEYNQLNGLLEGESNYYNQKGELLLVIGYENNSIKYYIKKSKIGQLTEKIVVIDETAAITSDYPNGKTAIKINFEKGNLEGDFVVNNESGKPEFEAIYVKNLLEGKRTEYYANGNVYKSEQFVKNDFEGIQHYFTSDGKPLLSSEYKNDEIHGNTLIYKEGKLVTTKKYDSDVLVEIIK
ncbi:hypothetical protein [Flavobacterium sp.]|uniref:hypothetical protein n=1 Tax=Flavobacterium sp. TaxID=239 RepID=UPI00286AF08D|nr:hypothetical protein [Flavobacterium sp.]